MDLKLTGKVALVTGSTAGIGRAIAERLLREGATVIVNGRTSDRVAKVVSELRPLATRPDALRGLAADISLAPDADRLIRELPDVDILINNMGKYEPVPFEQITDDQWLDMLNANVLSGIRMSRHYLPRMLKRKQSPGRIIFVSSESGLNTPTEMIHYGVSKTAQLAVARGLAQLCAGTAVTVNSILPGPTWSEGVEQFVKDVAATRKVDAKVIETEFFQTVRPSSLLKRFATVEEIADLTAFLASPLSAATNGAAVRCEGGILNTLA
jgi:NAD(P)-dependent dehydrogenase (short-subunit alcohol dehydrogenase family)